MRSGNSDCAAAADHNPNTRPIAYIQNVENRPAIPEEAQLIPLVRSHEAVSEGSVENWPGSLYGELDEEVPAHVAPPDEDAASQ